MIGGLGGLLAQVLLNKSEYVINVQTRKIYATLFKTAIGEPRTTLKRATTTAIRTRVALVS